MTGVENVEGRGKQKLKIQASFKNWTSEDYWSLFAKYQELCVELCKIQNQAQSRSKDLTV